MTTHLSGTVSVRPALIGVTVDFVAAGAVTQALRSIARVWGGCYSAVFSDALSLEELEARLHAFELDSLWTWDENHALSKTLRDRQLLWRGSGDYGPFGADRFRHGLLPWQWLDGAPQGTDSDDDPLLDWFDAASTAEAEHRASLCEVPSSTRTRSLNFSPPMIMLLDRYAPRHQVRAWNVRALSTRVAFVDDEHASGGVDWDSLVSWCREFPRDEVDDVREIRVWDLRDGSEEHIQLALTEAAERAGMSLVALPAAGPPVMRRRVLKTDFNSSFNVTIPYGAMQATVALPSLPLAGKGSALGDFRTVAADVTIATITGHDPRLVARLPDDARFSDLLDIAISDVQHVCRPTEWGFVAGVSAASSSITVPLHRKSEVFRRLLDAGAANVGQSDVGLFQTRAAEMLGGAAGGALTQPGLAAALKLLSSHAGGVPLPRLRQEITNHRGAWPGTLSRVPPSDYVESVLRRLVASGMVLAQLNAKCTYCRATIHLDPDAVANSIVCDFCGQEVRLAPMIGWGSPKWVFRLAGHLSESQVQAMIPALATLGQIAHLARVEGGFDCNELGLTVSTPGKRVEADIAVYLPSPIPVTLIGEVKSRNRVDDNDIANLEWLQDRLTANGVDSVIVFATAKDQFGPEERAALRHHCETRADLIEVRGARTPRLPLLLTGRDLFLPWMDADGVGRWGRSRPALAIHGTALESCRRNLGLVGWGIRRDECVLDWGMPDGGA